MKKIEILGTGCAKCNKLYETVDATAKEMNLDYAISKVQNIKDIVAMGATMTPALAVDGKVVHGGSIPTTDKLKELLAG